MDIHIINELSFLNNAAFLHAHRLYLCLASVISPFVHIVHDSNEMAVIAVILSVHVVRCIHSQPQGIFLAKEILDKEELTFRIKCSFID